MRAKRSIPDEAEATQSDEQESAQNDDNESQETANDSADNESQEAAPEDASESQENAEESNEAEDQESAEEEGKEIVEEDLTMVKTCLLLFLKRHRKSFLAFRNSKSPKTCAHAVTSVISLDWMPSHQSKVNKVLLSFILNL